VPESSQKVVGHPRWLAFICILFLVQAWAYGLVLPSFENLDEIEHFSAIRYIAETNSLPVHDAAIQQNYLYRQEASQPPLYYILMSGLVRLLSLPTKDTNDYLAPNPFVACGPSDNSYNKHVLYHNPSREVFSLGRLGTLPWDGALLTLHILRALTPFLQVITIVSIYRIARLVLPRQPQVAPLAAALAAFNPQFLSVASGVNNDNLVTPLATAGLYLALLTREQGPTIVRSIGLGVLIGLAGLSKLSGLLLMVLVGLVLLEIIWRSRHSRPFTIRSPAARTVGHGLLISVVAAGICGWWFWRNWQLYADPTALEPMLELVGRRALSGLPFNESGLMLRSFWGQLACAFFSDRFYWFFGLLTAAGMGGWLWGLRGAGRPSTQGMLVLALWFGITFAGWLRWGSITAATGGRLLFPAIASTSTLLAYGLLRVWPAAWRTRVAQASVLLLALVSLATLRWELYPLFAPPRTFAEGDGLSISHPLEATFSSTLSRDDGLIELLGYDAEINGRAPYLDTTFYWRGLNAIPQDYVLAVQLTSPIPGDDSLRFNYNTWPGRGNFPTSAWTPGQVIADRYRFKLPASDMPTQAWQLLVAFYEIEQGQRLPVWVGDQPVGKGLALTTLRLPGHKPECPDEAILDEPIRFGRGYAETDGGMISLTGAFVRSGSERANPGLRVTLCWNSLTQAPVDYTVFVHAYDESGALHVTGDGPPMNGAFPTRLWQPGDRIIDVHFVPMTSDDLDSRYRVGVGLYDLNTSERLGATRNGQPVPNDVVFLDAPP